MNCQKCARIFFRVSLNEALPLMISSPDSDADRIFQDIVEKVFCVTQ